MMLLLIAILIYWLVSNTVPVKGVVESNATMATDTPRATDILIERYAKGEIDRETYQAMRKEVD